MYNEIEAGIFVRVLYQGWKVELRMPSRVSYIMVAPTKKELLAAALKNSLM